MHAVPDSHNYRKHEEVARDLERRFGHERVQGAHAERDGVDRPDRTPSRAELRQEDRTGIKIKDVRAEITEAFRSSDNAEAFKAALAEKGYILARGDRRDYVVFDRSGGVHSLARRIEGIKAAGLREFMSTLDREAVPTFDEVKKLFSERRRLLGDAKVEKSFSRGADYVSQTGAAQRTHDARQRALNRKMDREIAKRIAGLMGDAKKPDPKGGTNPDPGRPRSAPGGGRTRSR
jgi:hypothetical protein